MGQAARFELSRPQARKTVDQVVAAVKRWKEVATSPEVGLQAHEINEFKPAFESKAGSGA
jgi:serine/threonine-protein kinase HipA